MTLFLRLVGTPYPTNLPPSRSSCATFPILNFQKVLHLRIVFGQNFKSPVANYQNFRFQDPSFFKENLHPRPYFWKFVCHTPKLSAPSPLDRFIDISAMIDYWCIGQLSTNHINFQAANCGINCLLCIF